LSRESDFEFRKAAEAAQRGAILVSFWHLPGMPEDSGTPVDWLAGLSKRLIHLECRCPVEMAALRFTRRRRHPGHLDGGKSYEQVLAGLGVLKDLAPLNIRARLVDTSSEIDIAQLVSEITGE